MDEKAGKSPEEEGLRSRILSSPRIVNSLILAGLLLFSPWVGGVPGIRGAEAPAKGAAGEQSASARVGRVIDGDTIVLSSGTHVRYIGIDTPELRKKIGSSWVTVNEPFAAEAHRFNRDLVEGKAVLLEFDQQRFDRYGRVLAYVYTVDKSGESGLLANEELIRAGLARVVIHPPNVRLADRFYELESEAKAGGIGLWKTESLHTR